jgi:hypothetical protein
VEVRGSNPLSRSIVRGSHPRFTNPRFQPPEAALCGVAIGKA